MDKRQKQIKSYIEILKDNEILLLKSKDTYFKNHYSSSPLAVLTGFLGSEGEAIIDSNGKIKIFVDTRYHLLVDKQVYDDVEVYKMNLGETFFEAFKRCYKKGTILHVPSDCSLKTYLDYDSYFDLRRYEPKKEFDKNIDFDIKSPIFKVSCELEKLSFLEKVQKLKRTFVNTDKMVVLNLDEISYLTNLRSYQMKFSSNFRSILFLDFVNSNYVLFSDLDPKNINIEGLQYKELDEFYNFVPSYDSDIHVNLNDVNLKTYLSIKKPKQLKQDVLPLLASVKPLSVIEELKKSFSKTDEAILNFRNKIKIGMSEYDLVQIFENELLKAGAKMPSFKTILAINENSASIHYSSYDKNKILKNESIILLDCGGYFEGGYATDITRTMYIGSNPKKIYKTIYTNVLKAFLACYCSKETNAKKLDTLARTILDPFNEDGFYFNHGLGHGIGTSVHQNPPVLSMISKDIIKPYQAHSIEPGLYGKSKSTNEEFGVRIENCVYCDLEYNKTSLSKFPFEEVLIDYDILTVSEKKAVKQWQESFK